MIFSYERVSTVKQDERRQEISLEAYKIDRRYIDKRTGKNADRPELKRLMLDARPGDKIYCESISRLARNVDDLRRIVEEFRQSDITIHFVKEGFDTSGNMYKFMLTILGAVAEMERELIVERVNEGLEKAKRFGTKSGKAIGRPPAQIPDSFEKYYRQMRDGKITKVEFAKLMGISRASVYRYIEQFESQG